MLEHYRCYFISRDGKARSLATILAHDAMEAVNTAVTRYPLKAYRFVEVWQRCDRVLTCENPTAA